MFGFAGSAPSIGATGYGVLVLTRGVAFSFTADGHLRYARLTSPVPAYPPSTCTGWPNCGPTRRPGGADVAHLQPLVA